MIEGKSALICENDPVQLKVLRAVIGRAGYTTSGARSPAEALRLLVHRPADLIVSDVLLDEGNAFDLLGGARRIGRDAPMIMISAFATETLRVRAFKEGVDSVLEKIPGHHELVARAGQLLRGALHKAREARRAAVEESRFARMARVVKAAFSAGRRKVLQGALLAASSLLAGVLTGSLIDQALRFADRSAERADRALQIMEARLMAPHGVQPATRPWAQTSRPSLPPGVPAQDPWDRSEDLVNPLELLGDDLIHPRQRILTEPSWNRGYGGSGGRR